MKKKLFLAIMTFVMFFGAQNVYAKDITAFFDGDEIYFDTPPFIEDGRTLAPMRAIVERLGAQVDYNDSDRVVTAQTADKTIYLKIDHEIAFVNNEQVLLDIPARIVNNKTFVPLRFISENFGMKVIWNQNASQIQIFSSDESYNAYFQPDTEPAPTPDPTPTPTPTPTPNPTPTGNPYVFDGFNIYQDYDDVMDVFAKNIGYFKQFDQRLSLTDLANSSFPKGEFDSELDYSYDDATKEMYLEHEYGSFNHMILESLEEFDSNQNYKTMKTKFETEYLDEFNPLLKLKGTVKDIYKRGDATFYMLEANGEEWVYIAPAFDNELKVGQEITSYGVFFGLASDGHPIQIVLAWFR